jgi:hypothetical protein
VRVKVRHGSAAVSWGPRTYGGPTITAWAPLSDEGFADLHACVEIARWRFNDGDEASA